MAADECVLRCVHFIGKSGAGKSTLLRLINLLERPDAGRVFVGDRNLTTLSRSELRDTRHNIGMISQQFKARSMSISSRMGVSEEVRGHQKLDIVELVQGPIAPLGVYSTKRTTLAEIKEGDRFSLPDDPSNLAWALVLLQQNKRDHAED